MQLQEAGSSDLLSLLADAASSEEGFAESDCSGAWLLAPHWKAAVVNFKY